MSESLSSKSEDEEEIRSLYQQMIDGWNKSNGNDFASPFDGTHFKRRQEIAIFHQWLFDGFLRGSRLVGKIRSIRFLTPDVAIMHGIGGTVLSGKTDIEPERNSVHTLVAIRKQQKEKNTSKMEWRLIAFQNSRAQYIGRPEQSEALTEELRQLLQ